MVMKKYCQISLIITTFCVIASTISIPYSRSQELNTDLPSQLENINVLALVGTNVGDNFLDVEIHLKAGTVQSLL